MQPHLAVLRSILFLGTIAFLISGNVRFTVAQENEPCSEMLSSRLVVGERGRVLPGSSNNVRAYPTTQSQILGQIPGGGFFRIMDGPVCAEGMAWWQVHYGQLSGWTAEGVAETYWLEPLPRITPENATRLTQFATLGRGGQFIGWLPDQQTLAMTSGGGVLLLNGDNLLALSSQIDGTLPQSVAISRDWTHIATARRYYCYPNDTACSGDYAVRIWNLDTGELLQVLEGHTANISELSFSPDGGVLRSYSWEDGVFVWDLATGNRLISPVGYAQVLGFNQHGQLYVLDEAGYISLWDVWAGQVVGNAPIVGPNEGLRHVYIDPNHPYAIFTYYNTFGFEVWDLPRKTLLTRSEEHFISADWEMGWIVEYEYSNAFVIRALDTGEQIQVFSVNQEEDGTPRFYGSPDQVVFSANHRFMVIRTVSEWCIGSLEIWDVATGDSLFYWDYGCTSVIFHPETDNLLIASPKGVFEWNSVEHSLRQLAQGIRVFRKLEFSANDSLLVAVDSGGRIHAWDATNWTELNGVEGYGGPVFAVSPVGRSIAYLGAETPRPGEALEANDTIRLWNPWTGRDDKVFHYKNGAWIQTVAFEHNGAVLGAAGRGDGGDPALWLWDVASGHMITGEEQSGFADLVTTLKQQLMWWWRTPAQGVPESFEFWRNRDAQVPVFSPDGSLLVSRCEHTICLLDAESGEQVQTMEAVEGDISSAAFSPDGQLLAATTGEQWDVTDGRLYVWETASGKLLAAPEGHLGAAWDVVFSPDGTVIASAGGGCYQCESRGWDNVVRLWRVVP